MSDRPGDYYINLIDLHTEDVEIQEQCAVDSWSRGRVAGASVDADRGRRHMGSKDKGGRETKKPKKDKK
jgi:hypothetical protein